MRDSLDEAFGFEVGQKVRLLTENGGDDADGEYHTVPAGVIGEIFDISVFAPPQNIAIGVSIPVDAAGERVITAIFDEGDGPISDFIEAVS